MDNCTCPDVPACPEDKPGIPLFFIIVGLLVALYITVYVIVNCCVWCNERVEKWEARQDKLVTLKNKNELKV